MSSSISGGNLEVGNDGRCGRNEETKPHSASVSFFYDRVTLVSTPVMQSFGEKKTRPPTPKPEEPKVLPLQMNHVIGRMEEPQRQEILQDFNSSEMLALAGSFGWFWCFFGHLNIC